MKAKKIPGFSAVLKWVVFATVVLIAFILVAGVNITAATSDASLASNASLTYYQSFSLQRQDGSGDFTQDDLKDYKITVINGWGPWCHNCVDEMPGLQELSVEYADKGLQIVGVVADYYGTTNESYDENIQTVIDNLGITYPVILSDEAFANTVLPLMGGCFPGTWVVDSNGTVIDFITGGRTEDSWRNAFDRWLAGETWIGA